MAIVGPSGCGKSTLVSLLLRFWDYETGPDPHRRARAARARRRSRRAALLSVVPQDVHLFNATIEDNLAVADAEADRRGHGARLPHRPAPRLHRRRSPTATTPSSARTACSSRAASAAGWPSPGRSSRTRPSSSSTRPRPTSTAPPRRHCGPRSTRGWKARRCWSSRTARPSPPHVDRCHPELGRPPIRRP